MATPAAPLTWESLTQGLFERGWEGGFKAMLRFAEKKGKSAMLQTSPPVHGLPLRPWPESETTLQACLDQATFGRPRRPFSSTILSKSFVWCESAAPRAESRAPAPRAPAPASKAPPPAPRAPAPKSSATAPAPAAPSVPPSRKRPRQQAPQPARPTPRQAAPPAPKRGRRAAPAASVQEPGPRAAAAPTTPAIPAGAHASGSSTQHVPAHRPADLPQLTPEKSKLLARSIKLEPSVQGEALTPACREALRKLFAYKPCGGENHFRLKINSKWAEQYAPDYFQHIEQPMDLSTMRSKSNAKDPANRYQSIVEFEADLRLIGTNAIAYNGGEHDVAYAAVDLLKYFNESVLPNMQQRGAEAVLDAQLKELHMRVQRQRAQHMRASAGQ